MDSLEIEMTPDLLRKRIKELTSTYVDKLQNVDLTLSRILQKMQPPKEPKDSSEEITKPNRIPTR